MVSVGIDLQDERQNSQSRLCSRRFIHGRASQSIPKSIPSDPIFVQHSLLEHSFGPHEKRRGSMNSPIVLTACVV